MLGEAHQAQFAVIRRVIAGCQPAHQVGAPQRCERQQQHKLGIALPRQLQGHVIRPDLHIGVAVDLVGNRPDIVTVVEGAHIGDVVSQQPFRLDVELALGHPDVAQQGRRHRRERLKQLRESPAPGGEQGITGITHIEPQAPVMGIHHRLDRVAEVAQPGRIGIAVWIGAALGEAIQQPVLMLLTAIARHHPDPGGDQIGLALKLQERGQSLKPLVHLAAQQQQRIRGEGAGEQDPGLIEVDRRTQALPGRGQGNPAATVVVGVDIDLALGIGKLLNLGRRDRVRGRTRGEIEAGPAHRQRRSGIAIADAQLGNALHLAAATEILDQEEG